MNGIEIPATEILNPELDDTVIAYWLSQFKKETWHIVIKFARPEIKNIHIKRDELIEIAAPLVRWRFASAAYRLDDIQSALGLVCYHADEDWGKLASVNTFALGSGGQPNPNWGSVNVGARLVCFRNEQATTSRDADSLFTSNSPFCRYLKDKYRSINEKLIMDGEEEILMVDFCATIGFTPSSVTGWTKQGYSPDPENESKIRRILDNNPQVKRVERKPFRSRTPFSRYLEKKYEELRNEKSDLTLAEFAALIGVKPQSMSNWTGNEYTPRPTTLRRVVSRLGGDIETARYIAQEGKAYAIRKKRGGM